MRVAGVLPSAELRLTVHARPKRDAWLRRAAMDANAGGDGDGRRDLSIGGNDEWMQLGAAPEEVATRTPRGRTRTTTRGCPLGGGSRSGGDPAGSGVALAADQPAWRPGRQARRVVVRAGTHRKPPSSPRTRPSRSPIRSNLLPGWIRRSWTRRGARGHGQRPRRRVPTRRRRPPAHSRPRGLCRPIERPHRRSHHGELGRHASRPRGARRRRRTRRPVSARRRATCEVTMLADEGVDEEARAKRWLGAGSRSSASLGESSGGESSGVVPGWAALLVNGNKRCRTRRGRRHARRGHRRAGERRRRSRGGAACPTSLPTGKTVTDAPRPRRRGGEEDDEGALPAIRLPPLFPVPDPILEPRRSRQRRRRQDSIRDLVGSVCECATQTSCSDANERTNSSTTEPTR